MFFLVALHEEDQNAGGCECLLDFFRNGFEEASDTGRRCWVIRSAISGYFEISASALEQLRQSVEWQKPIQLLGLYLMSSYALRESLEPWGLPLEFPTSLSSQLFYQDHAMVIALRTIC